MRAISKQVTRRAAIEVGSPSTLRAVPTDASKWGLGCSGWADEWHLDFANMPEHFTFDFVPGFHQSVVVFGPAFGLAWFKPVWPIADSMLGNDMEQVLIESFSVSQPAKLLASDQGLKGSQCLERPLEADGTW